MHPNNPNPCLKPYEKHAWVITGMPHGVQYFDCVCKVKSVYYPESNRWEHYSAGAQEIADIMLLLTNLGRKTGSGIMLPFFSTPYTHESLREMAVAYAADKGTFEKFVRDPVSVVVQYHKKPETVLGE